MPASSAMPDTDAPGCRLRSISSRLSAALCSRRRRLPCVSCSDMVCTKGLVHTIPGAHDQAIVLSSALLCQRALRPRLLFEGMNVASTAVPDLKAAARS